MAEMKLTKDQQEKCLEERKIILDKWIVKSGYEKVAAWMKDDDKRSLIDTIAYMEARDNSPQMF